jgi:BirA family biotin operon repressor/biotin-[acetyl-CoA-carboxylase] ligase
MSSILAWLKPKGKVLVIFKTTKFSKSGNKKIRKHEAELEMSFLLKFMSMETNTKITKPLKNIKDIIYLDKSESTQDIAKELAGEGYLPGTLVIAGTQTEGRGRFDRSWQSRSGGVYFSLILNPKVNIAALSDLNIKTAEAISQTLKKLYAVKTKIKPPNDVLAYNPEKKKFFKIAGVLIETSSTAAQTLHWIVLGVGVNLNNEISPKLCNATTIKKITDKKVSVNDFLNRFFDFFWHYYGKWEIKANSPRK